MATLTESTLAEAGIDGIALKPAEHRLSRASGLPVDTLVVDFEGREHVPEPAVLCELATTHDVRVTVPVRADGFDPCGDDHLLADLSDEVRRILVAGNSAYLEAHEQRRAIAPRLRAGAAASTDPWIGSESVERLALAVGGTQFELLSASTSREVRALGAAGLDHPIAVYAPTVLTDDADAILDALGPYAARRRPVRERLPDGVPTDRTIKGTARDTLLAACRDYALVGEPRTVADRIDRFREAGVDTVVAYPARGLAAVLP